MTENNYTCFVISPIGAEGSDVRAIADDALEYLIIPSLKICGFEESNIKRADKIYSTGSINSDILLQIKQADLCIVDVTGKNPNVMYECGLRHGNGKPYIMIMKQGEELPFDIAGTRTVFYDLSSVPNVRRAQDKLEKFILESAKAGFVRDDGTDSISSMSDMMRDTYAKLEDVSNKLDLMQRMISASISGKSMSTQPTTSDNVSEILHQLSPTEAFTYAVQRRDISLMEGLLPYIEPIVNEKSYITTFISAACARGSTVAANYIRENWNVIVGIVDDMQGLYELVGCYVSWCNKHDKEEDSFEFFNSMCEYIRNNTSDISIKAGLYNQTNRLYHGAYLNTNNKEYHEVAVDAIKRAIELDPEDGSYYYNLATLCLGDESKKHEAIDAIEKCLEFDEKNQKEDDDHLQLAYKIYSEAGENVKAADVITRLKSVNAYRWAILQK